MSVMSAYAEREVAPSRASLEPLESPSSGVSWPAVFAGAAASAALGFVLTALGAGAGLSSISPWPRGSFAAARVSPVAIVWIVLVQLLASALGGYLAGRLRTKWVSVHTHEVFFRDTAQGFLSWCVGLIMAVVFLSSLGATLAKDLAALSAGEDSAGPAGYFADQLFRSERPPAGAPIAADAATRAEAARILAAGLRAESFAPADRTWLASLVASRTGLSDSEAAARVDQTIAAERAAVDAARKAVAHSLYWLVVALLVGAFSASAAGVAGGRRRDYVWPRAEARRA